VSENDNGTSVNPNTEGLDLPSNAGTQINTKVDDSLREKIDSLVFAGLYRSRSEVVRRAVMIGIESIIAASADELKQREELVKLREAYETEVRELQKKYGFVK
jgi:Predicted transcriptional regulators containing the CopG/Arc/MetJ DNA-binding domain